MSKSGFNEKNPHSTHKDNFLERVKVTKYEPFKIVTEIQNSILFPSGNQKI
ncbi:hypothetical protein BPO_0535 [Bergeyella porcorum]|uniref:Uncharacterized protein n=1 Tax=Bergeyella porcorum TaxID=1735111 RepID=A0AAU0F351_9FLAO